MADVDDSIRRRGIHPNAASAAERMGSAGIPISDFRLAGGTALSWHLGHRISEDLDFFTYVPGRLADDARNQLVSALHSTDAGFAIQRQDSLTLHVTFHGCHVSFFERELRWTEPGARVREGLLITGLNDVAVLKWIGINTRGAKKDFWDLDALIRHGLTPEALYSAITAAEPRILDDPSMRDSLLRSLSYFDDAETDPDPMMLERRTWKQVKERCVRFAEQMATVVRTQERGDSAPI